MSTNTSPVGDRPYDGADVPWLADVIEMFWRQMLDMALEAESITLYREMSAADQLGSFLSGAITGLLCVAFASIRDDGRDAVVEMIVNSINKEARKFAEWFVDGARAAQGTAAPSYASPEPGKADGGPK